MVGPMIGAIMMPAPHTAIAWPCRSRGLMSMMVDCDSGASGAPKAPCRTRKNTISSRLTAVPQSAEAMRKPLTQIMNRFLRPMRSATQPVIGVEMACATM
jgi:hypothetical protein